MYILTIILPLLNFLILFFFGKFLGKKGVVYLNIILSSLATIISYFIFYEVVLKNTICLIKNYNWIKASQIDLDLSFVFDSVSSIMLCIILTISCMVQIYSLEYMSKDPHLVRFMSYLSLFTFFMIMLVTANNFLQLFLGWEGVGICSFLLISFWFTRKQANKASIKAIILNKIGDFGIMAALMSIFDVFGSLNYTYVFNTVLYHIEENYSFFDYIYINKITFITFMLFLGAVGKSAQVGLHTWLPDAMEGPTPVSALIHAATMVTAGVFLIIRCSFLFEHSEIILNLITIVGAITCFFAATTAIFQNDLKKVIAYSTCSQLGYMIFSCGLSNYQGSLFHLSNHAFFKALLFLSAGSIIHALNNEQDMRRMGGLINIMPLTYVMFLIGSLALAGFPFLSGFYSKDFILEVAIAQYRFDGIFAYWLGCFSSFCTAFYSFRLIYYTFYTKTNSYKSIISGVHEAPLLMLIPLCILGLGSIFIGYLTKEIFIGFGNFTFYRSIYVKTDHVFCLVAEFMPTYLKLIPVVFSILGILISLIVYNYYNKKLLSLKLTNLGLNISFFLTKKWYFDQIYNYYIVKNVLFIGYKITYEYLDKGLFEVVGPKGIQLLVSKISNKISKIQTGFLYHYSFLMILGFIFLNLLVYISIFYM